MRVGADIGMMVGGFVDAVNGIKAATEIWNQLSTGGWGMSLATDAGIIELAGKIENAGAIERVVEGIIGLGLVGELIKFAQKTRGSFSRDEYKKTVSGKSAKEAAKDVPSGAKGNKPYKNESGKDFAKRLCDEKFGKGNYKTGPTSPYNQIKKWGDRAFEN